MKMKSVMIKMLSFSAFLAGVLVLSSCASEYQAQPRSIGTDPSELKRSPCACLQVITEPGLPEWFVS